jgi:hypothetical protein
MSTLNSLALTSNFHTVTMFVIVELQTVFHIPEVATVWLVHVTGAVCTSSL